MLESARLILREAREREQRTEADVHSLQSQVGDSSYLAFQHLHLVSLFCCCLSLVRGFYWFRVS